MKLRGSKSSGSMPVYAMVFLFLLCPLLACNRSGEKHVTVFAASSLKELVEELKDSHAAAGGEKLNIQFESSATLARQIEAGAPADVFISAAPEWIDAVKPIERYNWLSNRLVMVAPKDAARIDIKQLPSLAMGNAKVPAGKYARAALQSQGIAIPARTIYGSNVRDVLLEVTHGAAVAGIVYATDATAEPEVKIIYTFPENSHPKILYTVGLIKPEGRAFFNRLRESSSIQAAIGRGFIELRE